jgi:hypothetical protein
VTGDAADKLARTRLAILEHVQRRDRRGDRTARESRAGAANNNAGADGSRPFADGPYESYDPRQPRGARSWMGRAERAARTWWQHHPAHMAVEVATPVLQAYAQRYPGRLVAAAAVTGAVLMVARPWRLISVTTIVVALLKSANLPNVLMSALSAADFGREQPPGEP